ncbi:MAG: kelch repeat-containing protein, partial [Planctomycetota bacterium]|nr:kelch repeat-containing protein [Planctomycetota bacterium]
ACGPGHWDTEVFDLATGKWSNLYPKGAPYKNARGPTDAPGVNTKNVGANKDGFLRFLRSSDPWERWAPAYYQGAISSDDGRIYAYLFARTLVFDPETCAWKDLGLPAISKHAGGWMSPWPLTFGSLAYDPVNKEVISVGGTSDEDGGTPGTWAFNIAAGKWSRVAVGSKELNELHAEAKRLHAKTAAFVNFCRNRFYVTETEEEARADLSAGAKELAGEIEKLAGAVRAARLGELEAKVPAVAGPVIERVAADLKNLAGQLSGRISSEALLAGQGIVDGMLRAERALAVEPCGRAASQMATDPINGKIVLFGGCHLDSYLADTWVYDCKTRTWEQRYPKSCPAARAGHTLAWLPKSGKVLLYGSVPFTSGYPIPHTRVPQLPSDMWVYDIKANEWAKLPDAKDAPRGGVGAAGADDVLVVVPNGAWNQQKRVTWGMKVDPSAAVPVAAGTPPSSIVQTFDGPTDYDRVTKPNPEGIADLLKKMPANVWTILPAAPRGIGGRDYCTASYDTARHQLLWWGGGHSAWHYNEMAHYSLRTATWSTGYAEEFPYAGASFQSPVNQSFNNRPFVASHVWDSAAYDPVSDRVVLCNRLTTWTYDPRKREWDYPPLVGTDSPCGGSQCMTTTPGGVVTWNSDNRLLLFDAKGRQWKPLPIKGGKLYSPNADSAGMCYDSKRNCIWMGGLSEWMYCYELATGKLTYKETGQKIPGVFPREMVYVPELDMLLCITRISGPGGVAGNAAFDPEKGRWVGLVLPCSDGKPHFIGGNACHSSVLQYDPAYKLAISTGGPWEPIAVCRFDKETLKIFDLPGKK